MNNRSSFYTRILLSILTFLAFLRLLGFTFAFGEKSLQLDFSAYYTAGESVNAHLSPYQNYLDHTPRIWDGYDTYKHSRFLYPPLVAYLFRLIALLPYHTAKYIWMYLSIISLFISVLLAFKAMAVKIDTTKGLIVLLLLFTFHPLLKHLAFGEIDAFTLLLMVFGVYLICNKTNEKLAGVLFAISVLLKLHNILILPFILFGKKWNVFLGFVSGSFTLTVITILLCGFDQTISYVTVDLPRIAVYGEAGTKDMKESDSLISSLHLEKGITSKDGRIYPLSRDGFGWTEYATLTQTPIGKLFQLLLSRLKLFNSQSIVSVIIFIILFSLVFLKKVGESFGNVLTQYNEFLFWQLAFVVILLSAPITWDTNTVWLVTLFPVLVTSLTFKLNSEQFSLILIALGLVIIMFPNFNPYPLLVPFGFLNNLIKYQYAIGEVIIFAGFIMFPFNENVNHFHFLEKRGRNNPFSINN